MNEFRQALDAHAGGELELSAIEHTLLAGLSRAPQLAAAHGAYIEAVYRSGRLSGESYLALIEAVRTFQQNQSQSAAPAAQTTGTTGPQEGGADKTQFKSPPPGVAPEAGGGAATQFRAPGVAATAGGAATGTTGTGGYTGSQTGSRPTGSNWSDPEMWASGGATLGPGSVVKDRFILEEELGRGGMGVVFKARDLRKEEAQDRNPYVALKLLNDEFRRHPESLKALQRESRKAQHLAHANVVTVYDFDRDGVNVFMVMELLEGRSLERVIRDAEDTGLPIDEALRLTRGLCRAMAYAHEQGVVHSDFKPANAFLTKEGVVKVFDFGIARAAKRADDVTGSTTLFDPGTLGALTPTYASCEMIEGLEPDPRDDVYAMACVAYELFTGSHPFNRVSAVQARDKQMTAKRPRGLKRYQWRALLHGLAFDRAQRTASATMFMNELMPRQRRPTVHIGVAAALVAILVIVGTFVPSWLEKRRERNLIDTLAAGDSAQRSEVVLQLQAFSPEERAAILLNDRARTGLINLFEDSINAATDSGAPSIDYPRARALLAELQAFLPDSLAVKDLEDRLIARENDEIKRLSDQIDDYLQRGLLIDAQGPQNVGAALAAIRRIDAENRLLSDPRLPGVFAEQAGKALRAGDALLAQNLIAAGLEFAPQDVMLGDLRDQAQRAMGDQQFAARAQAIESELSGLLGAQAQFADLDGRRAQISELRSIAPGSAVLAQVQQLAQREVGAQSAALADRGEHAEALALVARSADLLPTSFVDQQREELASAQGVSEERANAVAQIKRELDGLIPTHTADATWDEQFTAGLRRLAAYLPASDPYVMQVKASAAAGYLDLARELRAAQRLGEAGRMLEQARVYSPRAAQLPVEEQLLVEARAASEAAAQQRNRLAQLEALKHKLLVQARADEVTEALTSFKELSANLAKDDAWLTSEAPQAIGAAYLRLASVAAKEGRFANATTLAMRAGEVAPKMTGLDAAQDRFARYQVLDEALRTANVIDAAATRSEFDRLARLDAADAAAVKQRLARNLAARIRSTEDAALAARLTTAAQEIFTGEAILETFSGDANEVERGSTDSIPQSNITDARAPATSEQPSARAPSVPAGSQGDSRVAAVRPESGVAGAAVPARVAPDIACSAKLAGYGRRAQAVCYDTFDGGGRGPDLVVIPAGGPVAASFALGRTEVSNADYSLYCTRTGACNPPGAPADRPVTGISLEDAQNYVAWLSSASGAVYRLPTDDEWTFAVNAQGGAPDRSSVNCVVEIGGKRVRGVALEAVQSGRANGWGLYNYLGNAQEWVVGDSFIAARGGAYSDNISACSTDSSRPHPGSADPVTGLRVVREIG